MLKTDGILGLSPRALNKDAELIFNALKEQDQIDERIFSFLIRGGSADSVFTLGGYNESYGKGEVQWHKLIDNSHWTVNLTSATMGNHSFNLSTN